MLKAWMSLNPIPLFTFWEHNFFQLIQCIFFTSFVCPHQYLAIVEFMVSHNDFGISKMPMEYVGIACTIVLIRTFLLAFEINFSFHPITFLVIFSYKSLKVFTLDFPLTIGNPRYFSQSSTILAPIKFLILCFTSTLVFLLKNRDVFYLFVAYPKASSYCSKMVNNRWHSSIVAWQKMRLSSANKRWDRQTPPLLDRTPCKCLASSVFLSIADNPSAQNKNR